jgi:thioredoxin-like negative regulator of GroEL
MNTLAAGCDALRRGLAYCLGSLLFGLLPAAVIGQEVHWRHDYRAARHEAQEKGLPLLLDFGTQNCFWCKKLDVTTFRDPAVVRTLNESFIPLKVEAEKEPALTQTLRIESFPTVVFAAPDGQILDTFSGYVEVPALAEHLKRTLARVSNPEWMQRDYQDAAKAVAASDYPRAVPLLKRILEDGKQRPLQVKAQQLLQGIEQQAADRLVRVKQLNDKGQTAEATEALTELLRVFAGTQATVEGSRLLTTLAAQPEIKAQQRTRRARELLGQAKEEYGAGQYLLCIDHCEVLAAGYADLPEGVEAVQLAAEIKNNPEWMQQACESLSDRLGLMYLALAETYLKKGQPQQAVSCLERLVQTLPGSRQAELAQVRLAQIRGQPALQAEFKK